MPALLYEPKRADVIPFIFEKTCALYGVAKYFLVIPFTYGADI